MKHNCEYINTDIENIKNNLKRLPGLNSQLFMAPKGRLNDLNIFDYDNHIESAVLILIYKEDYSFKLILTKRSDKLKKHSGQISFPGGKRDLVDKSLIHTALRETREEIGVDFDKIEVIGQLSSLLIPVSSYKVYPFVAFSEKKPCTKTNTQEVDEIIEICINDLLNTENLKEREFINEKLNYKITAPFFKIGNHEIWGATAMILSEFLICSFPKSPFANLYYHKS